MANKKKKKATKKIGRPKRQFTPVEITKIEQMAFDNLHALTIANALGIPETTLSRRFGEVLTQKRAQGKALLSRQQKEKCANNDTTMLIWRGKNDLGQTDKQERILGVTDGLAELLKEIGANGSGLPVKQG